MYHFAGFVEAGETIIYWAMQPTRMAQIRRDPASEVVSVSPRRDFRPTGSWVSFAHSPTRRFAFPGVDGVER
jgi:hypothetical protein